MYSEFDIQNINGSKKKLDSLMAIFLFILRMVIYKLFMSTIANAKIYTLDMIQILKLNDNEFNILSYISIRLSVH